MPNLLFLADISVPSLFVWRFPYRREIDRSQPWFRTHRRLKMRRRWSKKYMQIATPQNQRHRTRLA
jgi:hypothetical protein